VKVSIAGTVVMEDAAREATGSWSVEGQKWFRAGAFLFEAGRNVLRLEGDPVIPHIDKIAIEEADPSQVAKTAPPPVRPPAASQPAEPWTSTLAVPPLPFEETCFDDDRDDAAPGREELSRWLAQAPGTGGRVYEEDRGGIRLGAVEGLLSLRSPWPAGAVLRLSLLDADGLKIHVWSGEEGVTLRFSAPRRAWEASRALRKDSTAPRPASLALAASTRRASPGPTRTPSRSAIRTAPSS